MKKRLTERIRPSRLLPSLILLLVIGLCAGALAAYRSTQGADSTATAQEFYFTLDLLGDTLLDEDCTREIHLYGGNEKTLKFSAQNYFDDKRITQTDVTYTTALSGSYAGGATLKLDNSATLTLDDSAGTTLLGGSPTGLPYELTIDDGYEDGDWVEVSFTSSTPYAKTLKLIFVLHTDTHPMFYRVEDSVDGVYASLVIMTNVDIPAGKLTVDWSAVTNTEGTKQKDENILQIDSTNRYVQNDDLQIELPAGATHLSSVTVTKDLKAGQSIEIYFFKTDPEVNYSVEKTGINAEREGNYEISLGTTE